MGLLVDPGVDDLGLLGLQVGNLILRQVGDISVLCLLLRIARQTCVFRPFAIILLSSLAGGGGGVLKAGISARIMLHHGLSLSWLGGFSYSKRFHLFPTQRTVVRSTPTNGEATQTQPSKGPVAWLLENFGLHLFEHTVDVLEVRHSKLLYRAYTFKVSDVQI